MEKPSTSNVPSTGTTAKSEGSEKADVAIIGGGPAGMEAALVLARTRKRIIVFDDPAPPRNNASHGVHNFLGLDGLLPAKIREIAWEQIEVYESSELRKERVVDIRRANDKAFLVTGAGGSRVSAAKIILAFGYHDVDPEVPGFLECWGETVIPCPFCDGWENRNRVWGIVGPEGEIMAYVKMVQNWTSSIKAFLTEGEISLEARAQLEALGVPLHVGRISRLHHTDSKLEAVTFDTRERVEVETLLWTLPENPSPLLEELVTNLGLALDENGYVKTNERKATNVQGVWAAGDVQGWTGALAAAAAGEIAATAIVHGWYD